MVRFLWLASIISSCHYFHQFFDDVLLFLLLLIRSLTGGLRLVRIIGWNLVKNHFDLHFLFAVGGKRRHCRENLI